MEQVCLLGSDFRKQMAPRAPPIKLNMCNCWTFLKKFRFLGIAVRNFSRNYALPSNNQYNQAALCSGPPSSIAVHMVLLKTPH